MANIITTNDKPKIFRNIQRYDANNEIILYIYIYIYTYIKDW